MKVYKIVVQWPDGNMNFFPNHCADNEQECRDYFETELGCIIIGIEHWANRVNTTT